MKIRQYKSGDHPQVLALWQSSGLVTGRSDTRDSLQKQMKRDPDLFLVAEEDGRIIGVIMGRWEGRRGWINRLAVVPEYRNNELGSKLVEEVEERLKTKGCEKVNLLIDGGNASVQDF
jgi:ribosomal protein S18 acetylase RimI-like enzyme